MKSKISFLQSIGRGIRLKSGKTHCNLFTIGDEKQLVYGPDGMPLFDQQDDDELNKLQAEIEGE